MVKIILIGLGATLSIDIWVFVLGFFKIKSLDYRYVGRWIANFKKGKFYYENITKTEPVKGELLIGWAAHYLIGISFAFLLFAACGKTWLQNPSISPAIIIGLITAAAPLFIMQPAFGFGIASSKMPKPNTRLLKSLITHLIYGTGLYATALLLKDL